MPQQQKEISSRLYYWVPRSEVAFIQATIDASEGLARVRTEKHRDNQSLIFLMTSTDRKAELQELLAYLHENGSGPIQISDTAC